ncbi:aminoglycoside phosphotransferase family protein [Primorskyibacter marinus]|uniref:aminoglycoside phosphotransferase family protein n=1 Tax=Primorskyibacter marinus TaxID=1977320 RepID=UPI000E30567D|nr:phosphotransferase [Primorskyibacter marinus]
MTSPDDFLSRSGWADADRVPLAGDASSRTYMRLTDGARSAVLMIDPAGDTLLFQTLSEFLVENGLSAPRILAADTDNGLLLLEDLGDALFARLAEDNPSLEPLLYRTAAEVLAQIHRLSPPANLPGATPDMLAQATDLAFDWYAAHAGRAVAVDAKSAAINAMREALHAHAGAPSAMILRDYHAENLLWLPDRMGSARAGLLDFQDAMLGHAPYDLMSLLQDARRDVPASVVADTTTYFLELTGHDPDQFTAAAAVLGAQRNLRILGVFTRLCIGTGKPHYIDLIPRVWGHLQTNLAHPALADLARHLAPLLPPPETAVLERLKSQCPTRKP